MFRLCTQRCNCAGGCPKILKTPTLPTPATRRPWLGQSCPSTSRLPVAWTILSKHLEASVAWTILSKHLEASVAWTILSKHLEASVAWTILSKHLEAPCGLDNPVQALPNTDKTARATRLLVAWTILSKHCPTRTRLSVLRGSLWLGQSCPSTAQHGQDCPCYAAPCGLDNPVQAHACTDKTVRATNL
ncbi:MAG: hypothetical protein KatS3mg017_1043 [Fimbriimonadales bacterium]|nr:MAG: hypothetical protein KatS3mg017_1043 [Fimbriimonadales bacterium]